MRYALSTLMLLVALAVGSLAVAAETAEQLLEDVDAIRAPGKNFTFDLEVVEQKGNDDTRLGLEVRVRDRTQSLVIYREPANSAGRALLMVGQNMWIYIPGTRRPIRISPQQQVLGGVSNADVARVVYSLEYRPVAMAETELEDGRPVYELTLEARNTSAAYQRITLWIDRADHRPLKADFFALSGRYLKTIYYKDYLEILGRERPTLLEVHDALNQSAVTRMRYDNFKVGETPAIQFQPSYLPRLR